MTTPPKVITLPYVWIEDPTKDTEEDKAACALARRETAAKILLATALSRAIISLRGIAAGIDGTGTAESIEKVIAQLQDAGESR